MRSGYGCTRLALMASGDEMIDAAEASGGQMSSANKQLDGDKQTGSTAKATSGEPVDPKLARRRRLAAERRRRQRERERQGEIIVWQTLPIQFVDWAVDEYITQTPHTVTANTLSSRLRKNPK
jgi:hypothetical protein